MNLINHKYVGYQVHARHNRLQVMTTLTAKLIFIRLVVTADHELIIILCQSKSSVDRTPAFYM